MNYPPGLPAFSFRPALVRLLLLAALDAGSGLAAEYPPYQPATALTGDLRITGETSAEPLMKLWVDSFAKFHPGLEIIAKGTSPIASASMGKEFLRFVLSQEGQVEVQRDGKYLPLTPRRSAGSS